MRFAYADPPYPGQSAKHYAEHPDYAGEVNHAELIARLEADYDGWALSTSNQALQELLPLCPPRLPHKGGMRPQVRVLSWVKPIAPPFPKTITYAWEPVILRAARAPRAPVRDVLVASPELYTFRAPPPGYVTGAKPAAFCRWLFECAGLEVTDELVDLFPGSRAVTDAWAGWRQQLTLTACE